MIVKADLHIHTTYSDGRPSPSEVVLYAVYKNLHVISITDHDTFAGSIIAKRYAEKLSSQVLVIPGIEVRTDHGDILVYCSNEVNLPRVLDKLIEKAHAENCLVVPAHPFDITRLGIGDVIFDYKEWDAIEVWNASSTKGANYRAIEAAKVLGKPGLANSDAHILDELGSAFTIIEVDEVDLENVLNAVRKGRVRPVFGARPFRVLLRRVAWSIEKLVRR
mgnify:CR=1 FL=1